jgi:hypothetical protein
VWLLIAWSAAIASVPRLSEAAPLPPARGADSSGDLGAIRTLLERRLVRAQLAALGVPEAEAAELWERLTPAERAELTARADELGAGGDPVAAGVAIAIVVAMFVILALEFIGRRIISRPEGVSGVKP